MFTVCLSKPLAFQEYLFLPTLRLTRTTPFVPLESSHEKRDAQGHTRGNSRAVCAFDSRSARTHERKQG